MKHYHCPGIEDIPTPIAFTWEEINRIYAASVARLTRLADGSDPQAFEELSNACEKLELIIINHHL